MRKIDLLLEEYGSSHKNETNKTIHWICVPLIMFSLFGVIWQIPNPSFFSMISDELNWVSLSLLAALIYYMQLSKWMFIGFVPVTMAIYFGNKYFAQFGVSAHLIISLSIFVLAWIGQFYGHKIEGKKPSFLKDVQFLLIGPAWLLHFIFKKVGIPY